MKSWICLALAATATSGAAQAPQGFTVSDNVRVRSGQSPRLGLDHAFGSFELMGDQTGLYFLDATNLTMPIWIKPAAPTASLAVGKTGEIGIGTGVPEAEVHIRRSDGKAQLLVQETSPLVAQRTMLALRNDGSATIRFSDKSPRGMLWRFGTTGSSVEGPVTFSIAADLPQAFRLSAGGNLAIAGTLAQMSDRDAKEGVEAVEASTLLERAASLPVATWSYNGETARHLGPMAQDFAAAFGFGADDKHLAPSDLASVSLVAAQALRSRERELADQIERLQGGLERSDARLEALRQQLAALEARLP